MNYKRQVFIGFNLPGSGAESTIRVESRDVPNALSTIPNGISRFWFFDVFEALIVVDGKEIFLSSERTNISRTYCRGTKVYSFEEIKQEFPSDTMQLYFHKDKKIRSCNGVWCINCKSIFV